MKTFYALGVVLLVIFSIHTANASTYPAGCTATTKFSSTTGHSCVPQACQQGDLFNSETGQPCSTTNSPSLVPGCNNTAGFSPTTGQKCDGSVPSSAASVLPVQSSVTSNNTYQIAILQNQYSLLKNEAMGFTDYQEYNGGLANTTAPGFYSEGMADQQYNDIITQMQNIQLEAAQLGGSVQ